MEIERSLFHQPLGGGEGQGGQNYEHGITMVQCTSTPFLHVFLHAWIKGIESVSQMCDAAFVILTKSSNPVAASVR